MSCILYRDNEKILVDPHAINGMIAEGWSKQPQALTPPPSAEDFQEFLSMHEELKSISDKAIALREDQIHELVNMNEVMSEEIDGLTAEKETLIARVSALEEELAATNQPCVSEVENVAVFQTNEQSEEPEKAASGAVDVTLNLEIGSSEKLAHKAWSDMKMDKLKQHAKERKIEGWALMRKAELVAALKDWDLQDGSQSAA